MKMNHKMNKIQIQELECLIVEHLTIIDEEQSCMGEVKLDNKCTKLQLMKMHHLQYISSLLAKDDYAVLLQDGLMSNLLFMGWLNEYLSLSNELKTHFEEQLL